MRQISNPDMILMNPLPATTLEVKAGRRLPDRLLSYFDSITANSRRLLSKAVKSFEFEGEEFGIPRFIWTGPKSGGDTIRLGLFAALNGDEPEGTLALSRFISSLEKEPELAGGFALSIYPLCNPTGFEDNTRLSRAGHALNRLFWTDSDAPEVRFLESEIWMQAFHGIINLRSDVESQGTYGFASGPVLSEALLEPALRAAEIYLPRNRQRQIEGFPARRGLVYAELYHATQGALRAVPGLTNPPFEITFVTPRGASLHLQVEAFTAALHVILAEYRKVIAYAPNL